MARKDQERVGSAGMKSLRPFALLGAGVSGLLSFATIAYADKAEHGLECPNYPWPHQGILSSYDHASFVHVGSARVTKVERPGLDLSKQPPAVRMNNELGYILTFKLKVKSVIPFSEPFTVDPENPLPKKDYDKYFSTLKGGIIGHHTAAGLFYVVAAVGFAIAT